MHFIEHCDFSMKGFKGAPLAMGRIVGDYCSGKETTVYGLVHDSEMERVI